MRLTTTPHSANYDYPCCKSSMYTETLTTGPVYGFLRFRASGSGPSRLFSLHCTCLFRCCYWPGCPFRLWRPCFWKTSCPSLRPGGVVDGGHLLLCFSRMCFGYSIILSGVAIHTWWFLRWGMLVCHWRCAGMLLCSDCVCG